MSHAMSTALRVSDVSGQRQFRVSAPSDSTVGEVIRGLLARMGLARNDPEGRPVSYRARLQREARHLNDSELVGDSLREDDELSLHPSINAG